MVSPCSFSRSCSAPEKLSLQNEHPSNANWLSVTERGRSLLYAQVPVRIGIFFLWNCVRSIADNVEMNVLSKGLCTKLNV